MEPENKKLNIDGDDYIGCLKKEEEKQLIEQFRGLKFFDPKIDTLFKIIFGNSKNTDVAKSLIKAVLPEEEEIYDLKFNSTEIYSNSNFNPDQRKIIVDINAEDVKNNKFFIIEMQIHEVPDLLGRAELSTSRIFDSLYTKNELVTLKKKIYSINFLYYDMFPKDKDYYHHIFPHEFNKKNVSIPFKDTVVIELKKFNEKFDESQINEELLLSNEKQRRIVERQLWFAFLSKINTLYHKPTSIDNNKYFIIKRKIKIKEEYDSQNQENVGKNQKKEDKMREVVVYIKNEISEKLFSILIKVGPIRKALELCVNLSESDIDKYVSDVNDHTGLLSLVDQQNQQLKKKDEELEEKDKKLEEKDKKLEEKDKKLEEKDKIIEELENIINQYNKRNNYNENNNYDNNKKTRI